jgi:hypothetical protein
VIDAMLMTKYVRRGPDGLGLWPVPAPVSAHGTDHDYAVGT